MAFNSSKYRTSRAACHPVSGQNLPNSTYGSVQSNEISVISAQPFSSSVNSGVRTNVPMGTHNGFSSIDSLRSVDQLLIKQTIMASGLFSDYRPNKKFVIKNSTGQNVFFAIECTDFVTRNCCDLGSAFQMKIFDVNQREVINFESSASCYPWALPTLDVKLAGGHGHTIGHVERDFTFVIPKFTIMNARYETILRVEGPLTTVSFGGDVDFDIINLRGTQIGKISKQWSGLAREFFTDSDYFGIKFPMDLDVYTKAALLGTCMLIDAIFYSK